MITRLLTHVFLLCSLPSQAGTTVPLDTNHWDINAQAHLFERYMGQDAIYIQNGIAVLKDSTFLNGSIEFDMFLTERQSFPGLRFRITDNNNMESFFVRPHLSGKPDANQAAPVINGITAFQFFFGPSYSFSCDYNFDQWTHVKIVVNGKRAQVYMDYSEVPHLSWNLVHKPKEGEIGIGGSFAPVHYANFKINKSDTTIRDFDVAAREPIENLVPEWSISDKFPEESLDNPDQLESLINERTWNASVQVEEEIAANISREVVRYDENPGNTVFAKIIIDSEKDQLRLFEFGYSDRVVAILNGEPVYRGNNRWRSRDYRYLGTIGLFDAIYLPLRKGKNTLLFAVSEDFGGWLITGRFDTQENLSIRSK